MTTNDEPRPRTQPKVFAPAKDGLRRGNQLRQPRLAELVAGSLRNEILSGNLTEGDSLPRQEDLLETFGVSPPAVREALRILETEGLIRVRRGNIGGAIVRAPSAQGVAYMVSLVLQSRHTSLDDVGSALLDMEPVCTALCARRRDRGRIIVPLLREITAGQAADIDDVAAFNLASRRFHEALVSNCGNDTLVVLVGALETIWSRHEHHVYELASGPTTAVLRTAMRTHEKLVDAIEAGDEAVAVSLARDHLQATQTFTMHQEGYAEVVADLVRPGAERA